MEWRARLNRLEAMFPEPRGRIPAATLTDEQITQALAGNCEWLGVELPAHPWSDEEREAVDEFWDSTFGLGRDFRSAGYSRYQLQLALRHSAAEAGLSLLPFKPAGYERPEDTVVLGPYHPQAGMKYRARIEAERQQRNSQHEDQNA